MPLIPQKENDKVLGQVLFASKSELLQADCERAARETKYLVFQEFSLESAAKQYREDPAHLIIIDAAFGLEAITLFIDDIRKTHRNQLFMLVMDAFDEASIKWTITQKIDQFIIRPYVFDLFLELVHKLVETKKLLRSFIQVEKRLDAYDKAIDQSFLISKSSIDGTIIEVNNAFCTVSGYSKNELIGNSYTMIASDNTTKKTIKELWETLLEKNIYKGRLINLAKNGQEFICDMVIFPIIDENEEICEFVAFMQDVTELVMTGRQLQEERTAYEKHLNNIKDYYLELFAKELRTPTHSILNFTEDVSARIKESERDDNDALLDSLDIVRKNGETIMDLVSSLLNISRIRSGEEEVRPTIVNANDYFPILLEKYKMIISQNNINIKLDFDENCHIKTDQTKFQIIIDALFSNALKYGNDEILIRFALSDHRFELSIEDNGNGITDPMALLQMFESQDLLGMAENANGVGLGLYLTKLLCTMLKYDFIIEDSAILGGAKVIIKGPIDYEALIADTL